MEILIIIGLVLLNGIFSMSEMSLVSSRKFKLENAKKKGRKGAIRYSDESTPVFRDKVPHLFRSNYAS